MYAIEFDHFPTLRVAERKLIEYALREAAGVQAAAAKALGLSRWALRRRMRAFGLPA